MPINTVRQPGWKGEKSGTMDPAEDARRFVEALFEPDDLIEQRDFKDRDQPPVFREWLHVEDLTNGFIKAHQARSGGHDVYLGANPRRRKCGGKNEDVALFRCLFADLDGVDDVEARRRINDACLPTPTMLVSSGHGVHAYWRLNEPMTDAVQWTGRQKAIIEALDSDPVIHDPARIMRWPGFTNNKFDPVPVRIIEVNDTRHDIEKFPQPPTRQSMRPATKLLAGLHGKVRVKTWRFLREGATMGNRHCELTCAAAELAGANYTIEETREFLMAANAKCKPDPKPVDEVENIIKWAYSKDRTEWTPKGDIDLVQRDGSTDNSTALLAATSPASEHDAAIEEVMQEKAGRTLTDTGNGERFARQWHKRVLWCPRRGWLRWDGRRFADDDGQGVEALAVKTARHIYAEAARCRDADTGKKIGDWAHRSESKPRIDAMLGMAKHLLTVKPEELDADPFALNVENGILDLRTGTLGAHDPINRCTKLAPVVFNPAATAPTFIEFIKTTFGGDPALIQAVQKQLGMMLTADVTEQYLFIYHGVGANGKSTLLDLVLFILGDYAAPAAPDLLTASKQRQHPTELADLQGKRLIIASETESGQTLRLQLVKQLTGDRMIKARMMHQDFYTFQRTHKLILMTNNRPRIRENTEATWRRIQLVPFDNVVPKGQRDPNLLDALKAEGSGILNWLIAGCLAWRRDGLGDVEAVTKATAEYRSEENVIDEFVRERCDVGGADYKALRGDIFKAFSEWCDAAGERRPNRKDLYSELRRIDGVTDENVTVLNRSGRGFVGVRVKP